MSNYETTQTNKVKGVVDICFLLDATGSMQPCINAIKNNITSFIHSLTTPDDNGGVELKNWRACVWGYRDFEYEPKHGREPLVRNPFTDNAEELKAQLSALVAQGGGDEPESLLDALYEVCRMGKTERGAEPQPDKWRYRSEAARCIIVFTDASFHPNMTLVPGGALEDVRLLMQQERMRLSLFAPEMECHYDLSVMDRCTYEPIEVPEGSTPVQALKDYTENRDHFAETLKLLAKSVSQSAAGDVEEL